jgi:hypothetical protein
VNLATSCSPRRLRHIISTAALLAAVTMGPVRAQEVSSACKLLPVAELEAAIGGKVSKSPTGDKQSVPGMSVDECSITLSAAGSTHPVKVRIVGNLGIEGAQAIKMRNAGQAREQQWKTPGAKFEQTTVGSALCVLAGRPSVASHTTCTIPQGEGYVEVDVVGSVSDLPSMATVGALVQKAASRL